MPRSYYPDNEPVEWVQTDVGAILTGPAERYSDIRKQLEIRLHPEQAEVSIVHRVTNTGAWEAEFAAWALSVMAPGGTAIVPYANRQTGLLANRVFVIWPYTKMNDPRVTWGEQLLYLKSGQGETPFKFGSNNEKGWAAYDNNGCLFVKTYSPVVDGRYPDYGVSFESYTNNDFIELETLSELQKVKPGETIEHTETWYLFSKVNVPYDNEPEVIRTIEGLIGR